MRIFLVLFLIAFLSPLAWAEGGTWVEAEGRIHLTGNLTREQAEQKALNQARSRAIELVTGVNVSDEAFLVRKEGMLSLFRETRSITDGRIIEEGDRRVTYETIPVKDELILVCRVRLKALVAKDPPPDPAFRVSLELDKARFSSGSPLRLSIRSVEDAYLYLFNLAADDKVYLIYPNRFYEELRGAKNSRLELPCPQDPFQISPRSLPGHSQDSESIKVVACRSKLVPPEVMSMPEFYRWLLKIPARDRAEDTADYVVYESGGG